MKKYNVGDLIRYTVQNDKTVYTSKVLSNSRSMTMLDKISNEWRTTVEYLVENYCNLGVCGAVFDFQIKL